MFLLCLQHKILKKHEGYFTASLPIHFPRNVKKLPVLLSHALPENIWKTTESLHWELRHIKLKKTAWAVLSRTTISPMLIGHSNQIFTTRRSRWWLESNVRYAKELKNIKAKSFNYCYTLSMHTSLVLIKQMQGVSSRHKNILWDVSQKWM